MMYLAALCVFLTAACGYDYRDKRIPNHLLIWMAILGVGWRFRNQGVPGALSYLGQAALIVAFLYPFFKIGCLGAGDVKLALVMGLYLTGEYVVGAVFYGCIASAAYSLVQLARKKLSRKDTIPFVPFLYLGLIIRYLVG